MTLLVLGLIMLIGGGILAAFFMMVALGDPVGDNNGLFYPFMFFLFTAFLGAIFLVADMVIRLVT